MKNIGGCECADCGNGRKPDRAWWKRIWQKEIQEEMEE